jgi:hypothetical protein
MVNDQAKEKFKTDYDKQESLRTMLTTTNDDTNRAATDTSKMISVQSSVAGSLRS